MFEFPSSNKFEGEAYWADSGRLSSIYIDHCRARVCKKTVPPIFEIKWDTQ